VSGAGPEAWPAPGPTPADLERRVAWWRAREGALERDGPPGLARALLGPDRPPDALGPGAHAEADGWLDGGLLRRELHGVLRARFGPALDRLGVDLERGELARARSWLDARRRLPTLDARARPSAALAALADDAAALALLCALFAPPAHGAAFGRYPERLAELARRLGGRPRVRAWDAGCATGEGTWELAAALLEAGVGRVEVAGTDAAPLVALMAARREQPHDPAATERLRAFRAARPALGDAARCRVAFAAADLRAGPPGGPCDLVVCHGVLGEGVGVDDVPAAVAALAAGLAPGGLLSVADRFRSDRSAEAAAAVAATAAAADLAAPSPGLYVRVG